MVQTEGSFWWVIKLHNLHHIALRSTEGTSRAHEEGQDRLFAEGVVKILESKRCQWKESKTRPSTKLAREGVRKHFGSQGKTVRAGCEEELRSPLKALGSTESTGQRDVSTFLIPLGLKGALFPRLPALLWLRYSLSAFCCYPVLSLDIKSQDSHKSLGTIFYLNTIPLQTQEYLWPA